jgi:CubicO group peptidase (beta-lactamase class C family)
MFSSEDAEEINQTIKSFPIGTEFSIAKIQNDSVGYYGVINTKNGVKVIKNENSIFEVGSITKVFTSTILAQMIEEQLVSLDEAIDVKLGFPLKGNAKITYKELSTHSSGLPRIPPSLRRSLFFRKNDNPYHDFSEEKLLNYLKNEMKLKKKGILRYSNLGAGLLGYTLTKYFNQSYDEMLKQRLFNPLRMYNTTTIREEIKDKLVTGLDKKGNPVKNWDMNILAGAGAVLSSVTDLSKFIVENIQGDDSAMNYQRQCIFEKGRQLMSLGWFILRNKIPNIEEAYFHNGGTGGYKSSMVIDFNKRNGVVVLSNVSGLYLFKGHKIDLLSYKLLK